MTRSLPNNFIALILTGLLYPWRALGYIARNKLWGLTLVSIGINVVLLAGLIGLTLWLAVPWLQGLDAWVLGLSDVEWLQWALGALSWLLWVLALLLLVAGNAIVLVLIGQAVASPFLDMLSEKIEQIELGREPDDFTVARTLRSVVFGITDLIWSLAFLAAVNLPIFFIGLITAVGAPVATALSFVFSALVLAQEFVTLPLVRRMVTYRNRWSVVWQNRWLAFGFGVSTMGLLMIPGVNLILLPLAAAGGTLAYCDLEQGGRLTPEAEGALRRAA